MADLFLFLELIELLKNIERRGWVIRRVPYPESVADHMYRMAIMCRAVPGFDEETRATAEYMALVHDMGEALVGDITPSDGVSPEDKYMREEMALKFLACTMRSTNPDFADRILELWHEFEKGETRVALLVRQIDSLECMHQAVIYEERAGEDMSEFMKLEEKITLPELKPLLDTVLRKSEELKMRKRADVVIVFVSGGPGVGKGTQCELLAERFGFHCISVGDLLREEAKRPTSPYRNFILESIEKSVLLPAQLTTQLLTKEIGEVQAKGISRFLLDGFPRSLEQATDFELKICNHHSTLAFDCSETELRQRLEHRSKSSGRIDDNPESITRRLQTFDRTNAPVMEYLQRHRPVHHIDCRGSINEVYDSVRPIIEEILQKPK